MSITRVYGDSITGNRCIAIKYKGVIDVISIEDLWNSIYVETLHRNDKDVKIPNDLYSIGKNGTWELVNEIIRHKTSKKIYKICQKNGETECTEDHSLITEGFVETKPIDLGNKKILYLEKININNNALEKSNKKIDLYNLLKDFEDRKVAWRKIRGYRWHAEEETIWFGRNDATELKKTRIKRFVRLEPLCKLLGFFVAEGHTSFRNNTAYCCGLSNTNLSVLKEIKDCMDEINHDALINIIVSEDKDREIQSWKYHSKCYRLHSNTITWGAFFHALCGMGSENKHVPSFIFNINKKYQSIFYEYYFKGDGSSYNNNGTIGRGFTTKSLRLCSGLCFMLKSSGVDMSIYHYEKKNVYSVKERVKSCEKRHPIKTSIIERNIENQYVYDLSLEGHIFVDACGMLLLHNTDSLFGTGVDPFNEKKMEFIGEYISTHMKEFTDQYNIHDNKFKMRIEKSADMFLMLDKKKCYIMHAVKEYKETTTGGKWKDLDEWDVTGFEKSDISELSNRNFVEMLKMICKSKRDKSIDVFHEMHVGLKKWKVELRSKSVPLLDLCPAVKASKPFKNYGRPKKDGTIGSVPMFVKAALYSNKNLGTNFYPGDKIPCLYVKGRVDVIAVPEEWNYDDLDESGFSVDYDTMYKKQVLVKVDMVCKMLKFKLKEVLSGAKQSNLESFGSMRSL